MFKEYLAYIGFHDIYTGGVKDIKFMAVQVGTLFRINEYDGAESIEIFDKNTWYSA
jgi:hypothetical protein